MAIQEIDTRHQVDLAPASTRTADRPLHALRYRAIAFGIVAAMVSVAGSWVPSVWGDEVTSILSAERSLPSLFRMLGHVDAVHGTYYFLMHFWTGLFGASPFSMRLPSAIAVGIAAAGVVVLADRLAGRWVGICAGIVFAVLPRTTYMGEEARGYAMSAAAAVWLTVLLVHLLTSPSARRRAWILYGLGVAVCGYVFLFSLLIVPVHLLVLAYYRRDLQRRWMAWAGLGLAAALPVLVYGSAENGQISFLSAREAATPDAYLTQQWFGNPVFATVAWAGVLAAFAITFRRWWHARESTDGFFTSLVHGQFRAPSLVLVAGIWLVLPMSLLLGVNIVHAIYSARYLSFAAPSAALVLGWLVAQLRRPALRILALVAVVALVAPTYVQQRTVYAKNSSDWSVDAAYIGAHAKAGQGILFDESTRPSRRPRLSMRAYPSDYVGLQDIALKTPWYETDGWRDSVYTLDNVAYRLQGIDTVWLIEYHGAGTAMDSYDLVALQSLGYSVVHTQGEHTSDILELKLDQS